MSLTDLPFCTIFTELVAFCCDLLGSLPQGKQQQMQQGEEQRQQQEQQLEQKVWQGVPLASFYTAQPGRSVVDPLLMHLASCVERLTWQCRRQ